MVHPCPQLAWKRLPRFALQMALATLLLSACPNSRAMTVTGYSPEQNDRFLSGFPTAPVPNGNATFVGAGRDWSGVGWASSDETKGFGFISPGHYLVARHYGGASQVRVFDQTGTLQTGTQATIEETGLGLFLANQTVGDLSMGTLQSGLGKTSRYGVLDLNSATSTNSPSNYTNLPVFLYGRGANGSFSPRIAATTISSVTISGNNSYCTTLRTSAQLEGGDSGSPIFADWTNPNGTPEAAILGNHAAINETHNFHSFLGAFQVINRLNELLTDEGRALRVVGNPSNTWVGSSSTSIGNRSAWGLSPLQSAPSDRFVRFNAATATSRSVSVDSNHNLRGLYFTGNASLADPFTFNGSSTLTIGRGGVTNYDNDRQVFNAPLALGDHQFWDAGPGGVSVANLATNGRLLEIRAGAQSVITGNLSGNGSLALESGTLTLNGTSSLTGTLWAHEGTLRVNGSLASAGAVRIDTAATLSGSGQVTHLQGSGTVAPGSGKGILRASSVNPSGGLDFAFEFSGALPVFGNATASGNDVLRLGAAAPFTGNLTAANSVAVYLDVPSIQAGQTFRGGFFTDNSTDFLPAISNATFAIYLRDGNGTVSYNGQAYSAYTGPLAVDLSTEPQTANFGAGDVSGRILTLSGADTFASWAATAFLENTSEADREHDADPNGDGVVNLLAYAYRLDPVNTPPEKLPQHQFVAGESGGDLVFSFRRNKLASDLQYIVQISDDLAGWSDFQGALTVIDANPDGDGGAEVVEARIPVAPGDARKFARLRVVR